MKSFILKCPDKNVKIFYDERGLSAHLDKSPECTKILTKMLYCQPIINNTKTSKNLQSKLTYNSFSDCEDNNLSNSNDNNITNDSNSVAIRDNISINI